MVSPRTPELLADATRSPWAVLFTPRAAFASLRQRPRTALLLLAAALFAAAPAIAFLLRVDVHAFLLEELRQSGRLEEMPPEALSFIETRLVPAMKLLVPGGAIAKRLFAVLLFGVLGFAFLRAHTKDLRLQPCLAACALGTAPSGCRTSSPRSCSSRASPRAST